MPEWLLKGENYSPEADKDTFVNKSILSFLGLLSHIRAKNNTGKQNNKVHAVLKVFFTFVMIALLSISKSYTYVVIINVYLIATLSLMQGEQILKIIRVAFGMTVFTFVIFIPSLLQGNSFTCIMITSKVFATVIMVNILSQNTQWNEITSAIKTFFVPDIFVFVLDITMKYIVLLGEFSLNMLYALKLRSVGRNKTKSTSLSGIAGTMFIKSKEMAEDMHAAMECRGFTGEYRINRKWKFSFGDAAFVLLNAAIIVIFVYFERI